VPAMLVVPLLPAQMQGMSCRHAVAPLDDEVQGIWPCYRGNLPLPPSAIVKLASVERFRQRRCAISLMRERAERGIWVRWGRLGVARGSYRSVPMGGFL
jgi:hypothetical protein